MRIFDYLQTEFQWCCVQAYQEYIPCITQDVHEPGESSETHPCIPCRCVYGGLRAASTPDRLSGYGESKTFCGSKSDCHRL
ncbi:hypothetical protein SAMN05444000_106140 [Shimia gijangensis]|uniref:Uncharacterized protein n=1 Tax=Shimia gijangensis TaxID=1470563 RepID=A0A1M6HSY8_9RHOB|nr:hypothetical protein SAMN05444000_106140 [Shimia gijangensis]